MNTQQPTREQVVQLANMAGFSCTEYGHLMSDGDDLASLNSKALSTQPDLSALNKHDDEVAEACAIVADNILYTEDWSDNYSTEVEDAIRAGKWREYLK